jgi:hypothetical protein
LREIPASIGTKERFVEIAKKVEGKSAKECYARFKELCARSKK